ncbi:hypothetical protein LXL04_008767 [Taraxacum kok-saghyz]
MWTVNFRDLAMLRQCELSKVGEARGVAGPSWKMTVRTDGQNEKQQRILWTVSGAHLKDGEPEACMLLGVHTLDSLLLELDTGFTRRGGAQMLFGDFRNPSKHGFRNTYLEVSLISRRINTIFKFLNFSSLFFRFLIPEHLSSIFGYQHFRLCKCAFDNPILLHLSWF